jgi:hypothetical protein
MNSLEALTAYDALLVPNIGILKPIKAFMPLFTAKTHYTSFKQRAPPKKPKAEYKNLENH